MITQVANKMITYFEKDIRRINHALKVFGFANAIAAQENLTEEELTILLLSALLHDIGIKVSEIKYNSSSGKYQEIEGPSIAKDILKKLDIPEPIIEEVCYIIGHHHTYAMINSIPFQILVEADCFVNIEEEQLNNHSIMAIKNTVFKTVSGLALFHSLYEI
jgi:HD superfamily phosphodiesterase